MKYTTQGCPHPKKRHFYIENKGYRCMEVMFFKKRRWFALDESCWCLEDGSTCGKKINRKEKKK